MMTVRLIASMTDDELIELLVELERLHSQVEEQLLGRGTIGAPGAVAEIRHAAKIGPRERH